MPIFSVIVAAALLFFGERLYWLFAGGIVVTPRNEATAAHGTPR